MLTVLDNDTDVDGGTITITSVSTPTSGGTATANADGTITYKAGANFNGTDTFTYTLNGGDTATVSVNVGAVNDAPVANPDSATVAEGATAIINVLGNDTDADNDVLDPSSIDFVNQPAHGTVITNPDGSVTYFSNGDEVTTDSFTYTMNDGSALSNLATVTITITPVNDAPVASPTFAEPDSVTGVVTGNVNGSDPDDDVDVDLPARR